MATQTIEQQDAIRWTTTSQNSNLLNLENQEWYQGLTSTQQNRAREIHEKMIEIHKQLEIANATSQITGTGVRIMNRWVQKNPTAVSNPEFQRNQELMELWQKRFDAAKEQSESAEITLQKLSAEMQALRQQINTSTPSPPAALTHGNTPVVPTLESNNTISQKPDISKMTNVDILKLAPTERLPYITRDNKESSEVASGVTLEFTFSSGGKLNRDLYMYTTAGQVLPNEVREVSSNGVSYTRQGLSGEFYNPDNNKRLVIGEGTRVKIEKTEEASKISQENSKKYSEFTEQNPEYAWEKYKNIIETAIEKWIEPKMFAIIVERRSEEFESQNKIEQHELDIIAADIGRALSAMPRGWDRYPIETASKIAQKATPTTWQETLEKYGYKKEEITLYRERNPEKIQQYNLAWLNDFTPAEYSYPVERSESGTTLCSKTAWLNLQKLWVTGHPRLGSANKSMEAYGSNISTTYPPSGWQDALVWDFYLGWKWGSENFQKYGHRVAGFQKDGQWYILDPYYKINWVNTRQPIAIEDYSANIARQWKNFKWVKYFS